VTYRHAWQGTAGGEIVFSAEPPKRSVQSCCGRPDKDGPYYLHARLRPDVTAPPGPAPYARHAVFLLDTSPADNGARFARRVKLLEKVLAGDDAIEHFNVLVGSTTPAWLNTKGWLANTRAGRADALARLEGLVLEGATDLGAAFEQLARPRLPAPRGTPVHAFFLSDGRAGWGEATAPRLAAIAARSPWAMRWHCFASGAREENAELYGALARSGGGTYRLASEDDLATAAAAHRQPCLVVREVRFVGGPLPREVLVEGGRALVYPNGDLVVAARFDKPGATRIEVSGELAGKEVVQRFDVEVDEGGSLAARAWGELAVGELLASRGANEERLAVGVARSMGIASRATRFAFLSDPDRARRPAPPRAPLRRRVAEGWKAADRPVTAADRRAELRAASEGWLGPTPARRQLLEWLALINDCELTAPAPRRAANLPAKRSASAGYLAALKADRADPGLYLDEATRRARAGDGAGAVRCLTGLLVEHPGRDDVARVVACRLVAMGRAADAIGLMQARVEGGGGQDPANHRALSLCLSEAKRPGLAIVHAEAALALLGGRGGWHAAAREELAALLRAAEASPSLCKDLRDRCRSRLEEIGTVPAADVTVTLTWCTVAASLDLAVIAPGGKKLKAEDTQDQPGHRSGPRQVRIAKAPAGPLVIEVTYRDGAARSVPEVAARIEVVHSAGAKQTIHRHAIVLRKPGESWKNAVVRKAR
jgi:hypothetical protein